MRRPNTTSSGASFDKEIIEAVWRKAEPELGHGSFRVDRCGASMQHSRYGDTTSPWGWEIDHIIPVSRGGTDELSNLQPLNWKNNRHKGESWPHWSCMAQIKEA